MHAFAVLVATVLGVALIVVAILLVRSLPW